MNKLCCPSIYELYCRTRWLKYYQLRHKGVFVLYINLREPRDAGFPKRDDVPARILTENTECSQAEYTARCCALFAAIFQTLQLELVALLPRDTGDNADCDAIKVWNDDMCDMCSEARADFFEKVQTQYQKVSTGEHGYSTEA